MHNRDIEHLVNELQLENLYGFLHEQDHEDRLRVTTGVSTTLTSEDCGAWRRTITGMSRTSPRAAPEESQRSSAQFVLTSLQHNLQVKVLLELVAA